MDSREEQEAEDRDSGPSVVTENWGWAKDAASWLEEEQCQLEKKRIDMANTGAAQAVCSDEADEVGGMDGVGEVAEVAAAEPAEMESCSAP